MVASVLFLCFVAKRALSDTLEHNCKTKLVTRDRETTVSICPNRTLSAGQNTCSPSATRDSRLAACRSIEHIEKVILGGRQTPDFARLQRCVDCSFFPQDCPIVFSKVFSCYISSPAMTRVTSTATAVRTRRSVSTAITKRNTEKKHQYKVEYKLVTAQKKQLKIVCCTPTPNQLFSH